MGENTMWWFVAEEEECLWRITNGQTTSTVLRAYREVVYILFWFRKRGTVFWPIVIEEGREIFLIATASARHLKTAFAGKNDVINWDEMRGKFLLWLTGKFLHLWPRRGNRQASPAESGEAGKPQSAAVKKAEVQAVTEDSKVLSAVTEENKVLSAVTEKNQVVTCVVWRKPSV